MDQNVVSLINELSREFIKNSDTSLSGKQIKVSESDLKAVSRKAYDVIHSFQNKGDACYTCYGVEWGPSVFISDYCYELERRNELKASEILRKSIEEVDAGNFFNVSEILQLLLHLRKPLDGKPVGEEHPFSFTGNDYFFKEINPFNVLPNDITASQLSHRQKSPVSRPPGLLDLFTESKINDNDNEERMLHLNNFTEDDNVVSKPPHKIIDKIPDAAKEPKEALPQDENVWYHLHEALNIGCDSMLDNDQFTSETFTEEYAKEMSSFKQLHFLQQKIPAVPKQTQVKPCSGLLLDLYANEMKALRIMLPDLSIVDPVILELQDYVEQVKYLLIGVESAVFTFDKTDGRFYLKEGSCLSAMQPHSLQDFSRDFLLAGSCFVKVKRLCEEGLQTDVAVFGTVYKTLWKNILDYLQVYCEEVSAISLDTGLIALKSQVFRLFSVITTIFHLFCKDTEVPLGGQLLSYLFTACLQLRQQHVKDVLLSFLYSCCSVYISKALQVWIFEGKLTMTSQVDFFVVMDPSTQMDRTYYTRVKTNKPLVPAFLEQLSDRIMSCGRAVHLLKLFNQDNKFALFLEAKKYPKMKLCFNSDEMANLVTDYGKYEQLVNELNGDRVSFATLLEKEQKMAEARSLKIKELLVKTMAQREVERAARLEREHQVKEARNQQYRGQLAAYVRLKEERKQKELNEEKRCQVEVEKAMEKEKALIEEGKKATREYYDELLKSAQKQKNKADWREKRMQNLEKRSNLLDDVLNDNNVLDNEGNIIVNLIEGAVVGDLNENVEEETSNELMEKTNEIFEMARMEAEKNKKRIMNSEFELECPNGDNLHSSFTKCTGEALVNKNRMMNCSYNGKGEPDPIVMDRSSDREETTVTEDKSPEIITEAIKNKYRMMGFDCSIGESEKTQTPRVMTEAIKNKMKVLGTEYNVLKVEANANVPDTTPKVLTEAMRNKLKVLGMEYGSTEPAVNSCEHSEQILSEAMKNKMKILGTDHDFGIVENQSNAEERPVKVVTEAMLNKMKILSTDFTQVLDAKASDKKREGPLTEAEKNKLRVMGVEYNVPLVEESHPDRELTVRQHIKNKVLGTELGGKGYEDLGEVLGNRVRSKKNDFIVETATPELLPNETPVEVAQEVSKDQSNILAAFSTIVNIPEFTPSVLFPSIESSLPNQPEIDLSKISADEFELYLTRSIEVALCTQERLANAEVLKLFIQEHNFMSHVFSLRCYFLLYDGEFCRSLTNNLMRSLASSSKPKQFFESNSLSTIVNEALAYTIHSSQTIANNLSFQIVEMPAKLNLESHDMLAPFQLSYKVEWPMNIILTEATLTRYRHVFHTFLKLKRLHWCLNESFLRLVTQSRDKALNGILLRKSPHYTKLTIYRHAMTLFVMTLQEHICANGPYKAWETFVKELTNVHNLEQLYLTHVRYLKEVLKRCFLVKSSQDLLGYIHQLVEIGLKFHYTLKNSSWILMDNKYYVHPNYESLKVLFNKFCKATKNFQNVLRKRVAQNTDMRCHQSYLELLDVKIKI